MRALLICSCLVSSFLTDSTQQIHSLRARGVRFSQAANTFGEDIKTFFRSSGTSCTTPPEILLLDIGTGKVLGVDDGTRYFA